MSESVRVSVGGRTLSLSNLDKVLYPAVGFTKAQVIDYYARIAPVLVPHVSGRCMTLRRWPDGVESEPFYAKRCPGHRPEWLEVALGPGDRRGGIDYCQLNEPAAVVWAANMAALELHAPMAHAADIESPSAVVFDLDPGAPATIVDCCRIALLVRDVLGVVGLEARPKTSGGKGLQVYVPLNSEGHTHHQTADFAKAVGQVVVRQRPDEVLVEMTKALRAGRVFIDWSQNSRHKTTIAPYSLRGNATPTVSTPLTWDEVVDGADGRPLTFGPIEVLERVDKHGDLFEPVASLVQQLPAFV